MVEVINPASRAYAEICVSDGFIELSCWTDPADEPGARHITKRVTDLLGPPARTPGP
jgi:hypothetical protein